MLFYILLSIAIIIGGWAAYNKFIKKEDTWSGSPIGGGGVDGQPSIDTIDEGSNNYRPKKITKKNTPKGIDLEGEWDVIEKEKSFPKEDFEKPLKKAKKPALPAKPKAKRKYKPRKKK